MNPDQAIFDAIAAATSQVNGMIVIDVRTFIERFNGHRDRALCTSVGVAQTPMLPCPVCGGEAIHAVEVLKRVVIKP